MASQENSATQSTLAKLVPTLIGFAKTAESLAERFKGAVLWGTVSGGLAAAWLAFFTHGVWHFSVTVALIVGVVLGVPAMILGWCGSVLDDAVGMPQRILDWAQRAKGYAGDAKARIQGAKESASRFKDLWSLGSLSVDLAMMGSDARELMGIVGGTLALTNPVFLFALIGSVLSIGLLDLLALISGLFYLFR